MFKEITNTRNSITAQEMADIINDNSLSVRWDYTNGVLFQFMPLHSPKVHNEGQGDMLTFYHADGETIAVILYIDGINEIKQFHYEYTEDGTSHILYKFDVYQCGEIMQIEHHSTTEV
ncbi:hypothetical protein LJC04_06070 [Ruminococcaceae bacterium OttesenSCG-928-O06]|nr:hypothetical protein [Ruminococcaceae bacterium OttesenSCG-928-O06]